MTNMTTFSGPWSKAKVRDINVIHDDESEEARASSAHARSLRQKVRGKQQMTSQCELKGLTKP